MKIAITAQEGTPEAEVDSRFGRAPVFMLHDTETGDWTTLPNNQNLNAAQGAGIQAGQNVIDAGADVVITGHCGPKAFRILQAGGVAIALGAKGTVTEALKDYKNGKLSLAQSPDVEGHWV